MRTSIVKTLLTVFIVSIVLLVSGIIIGLHAEEVLSLLQQAKTQFGSFFYWFKSCLCWDNLLTLILFIIAYRLNPSWGNAISIVYANIKIVTQFLYSQTTKKFWTWVGILLMLLMLFLWFDPPVAHAMDRQPGSRFNGLVGP